MGLGAERLAEGICWTRPGSDRRVPIARSLAPADALNFLWSVGIASAEFQLARYGQSVAWYHRALAENPASTWTKRFLRPAYVFAGRTDEVRHTFAGRALGPAVECLLSRPRERGSCD